MKQMLRQLRSVDAAEYREDRDQPLRYAQRHFVPRQAHLQQRKYIQTIIYPRYTIYTAITLRDLYI